MPYIYLDCDAMDTIITDLKNFATAVEARQARVTTANTTYNYPIQLNSSGIGGQLDSLNNKASEIKKRIDMARTLNENGVTMKFPDKMSGYYIPDGVDDTADNAEAAGQAMLDAKKANDSSTGDEELCQLVTGSVYAHKDNPVYASTFCEQMGAEGMLNLAYLMQVGWDSWNSHPTYSEDTDHADEWDRRYADYQKGLSALSCNLATASNSDIWTADQKTNFAKELTERAIVSARTAFDSRALNLLLAGSDSAIKNVSMADGQEIPTGGTFDKQFLNVIAQQIEDDERNSDGTPRWLEKYYALAGSGLSYIGRSGDYDPLTGLLTAMGRNREAAVDYLAPTDANGELDENKAEERWKMLSNRRWDSSNLGALTAAMAGASTMRKESGIGERATWAVSKSVEYSANNIDKGDYSDEMKENTSVMMANCGEEIHNIANGYPGTPLGKTENRQNINTVLYRIMDNKNAIATVSEGVSNYDVNRPDNTPDDGWSLEDLETKYQIAGHDLSYLRSIVKERIGDNTESTKEMIDTIGSVFSQCLGAAAGVVPGGSLAVGIADTIVRPRIVDSVNADPSGDYQGNNIDTLQIMAIAEAYNKGLLFSDEAKQNPVARLEPNSTYEDADGNVKTWTDGDGNIVLPNVIDDDLRQKLKHWILEESHTNDSTHLNGSVTSGYVAGESAWDQEKDEHCDKS